MKRLVSVPARARVDAEAVFDAARDIGNHAELHSSVGSEVTASWFRVADGYSAPETQRLLRAMEPVRSASEGFKTAAQAVARALTTFAIEAEAAETRRGRAASSIASFRSVASGDDLWQQDPTLTAQNAMLASEVAAAERELCEAEETCARTIASIPVDAPALATSAVAVPGRTPAGAGGWGYPDDVSDVVLNPFFFWGMKPEDVKAWWDTVPAESQVIFIASFPALIGNKDGIPAKVRDEANRIRLEELREKLEAESVALADKNAGQKEFLLVEKGISLLDRHFVAIKNPLWNERAAIDGQIVRNKLRDLIEIQKAVARENEEGEPRRYLLLADFSGVSTKAAVAIGDPDVADHIGVVVGGTTTNVKDSLLKTDDHASSLRAKSVEQLGGADDDVSIVSWLGYDAPQTIPQAASREYSTVGAPDLARFTGGLHATSAWGASSAGPHITVAGHSYGAVPSGDASAIEGSGIDDVIVYGAPAAGDVPADHVGRYSMLAPDDPISMYHATLALTDELGQVPYDKTLFPPSYPPIDYRADGWVQLTVTAEPQSNDGWSETSSGHSQYLNQGTQSQFNIANVIVGRSDRVG